MKVPQIYILIDPITKDIRYVGKTVMSLKKRLWNHCNDKSTTHKTCWIRSLKDKGVIPIIRSIETCNESELNDKEIYWISQYREKYDLTNLTNGGDGLPVGFKHKEESKKKIRETSKIPNRGQFQKGHKRLNDEKAIENLKKTILVYDIDGNFLKEIKGIKEASEILKINKNMITSCLKQKIKHIKEYRFFYYKEGFLKKIESIRNDISIHNRKIKEYENGIFVREYKNAKEASEILKIDYKLFNNKLKNKSKFSRKYPNKTWSY